MLRSFGATVEQNGLTVSISPPENLYRQKIIVPGDISSAAFFIVAGLITPGSEILIRNVGINPTRNGILKVCEAMEADITYLDNDGNAIDSQTSLFVSDNAYSKGEPVADILVRTSNLKGTVIEGSIIPTLIDELPVIALLSCFAEGTTIIKDAQELKVKESNRIDVMVNNLSAMGADITGTDDGMIITGGKTLHGALIHSFDDHRIAMSFAIASLLAEGTTTIEGAECVNISYPDFYKDDFVLDAKYKRLGSYENVSKVDNGDIFQMVSYLTILSAHKGGFVSPLELEQIKIPREIIKGADSASISIFGIEISKELGSFDDFCSEMKQKEDAFIKSLGLN
jgi:3-phosphoshikimate 1-carboxyvinyltransferase